MVFDPNGIAVMIMQSERTTEQMKSLLIGGLFVWCVNSLHYPEKLARAIGREDLKIVRPCWVMGQNWKGLEFPGVAVDHAYGEHNTHNALFNIYIDQIKIRAQR